MLIILRAVRAMLKIENVTKRFGGLVAVDHVTMTIEDSQRFGIIGPNGSGKTTLLNLITGLYEPDAGSIYVDGTRIDGLYPHQVAALSVGRTFQIPKPLSKLTVFENLLVAPKALKLTSDPEALFKRADNLLETVGLTSLKDELAGNLSGGQQKLLEIIRVLIFDPKILLLDEPTAGVHPTLKKKFYDLVRKEKGKLFLIVSHDIKTVFVVCERIAVLSAGAKIVEGTPDEIRNDSEVIEAYLGKG